MWKDKVSSFHTPCLLSYLRPLKQTSRGSLAESPLWDLFCYSTCMPGRWGGGRWGGKTQGNTNISSNCKFSLYTSQMFFFTFFFFLFFCLSLFWGMKGRWRGRTSCRERGRSCPHGKPQVLSFHGSGPGRDVLLPPVTEGTNPAPTPQSDGADQHLLQQEVVSQPRNITYAKQLPHENVWSVEKSLLPVTQSHPKGLCLPASVSVLAVTALPPPGTLETLSGAGGTRHCSVMLGGTQPHAGSRPSQMCWCTEPGLQNEEVCAKSCFTTPRAVKAGRGRWGTPGHLSGSQQQRYLTEILRTWRCLWRGRWQQSSWGK